MPPWWLTWWLIRRSIVQSLRWFRGDQGSEKQRKALRNTKSVAKRNAFRSGTLCETATETKKRSATQSETATQIRKMSASASETETLFENSFRNAKVPLRNERLFFLLLFYGFFALKYFKKCDQLSSTAYQKRSFATSEINLLVRCPIGPVLVR